MAESTKEWSLFQSRRDEWEQTVVRLEQAKVNERNARWKFDEAAQELLNASRK